MWRILIYWTLLTDDIMCYLDQWISFEIYFDLFTDIIETCLACLDIYHVVMYKSISYLALNTQLSHFIDLFINLLIYLSICLLYYLLPDVLWSFTITKGTSSKKFNKDFFLHFASAVRFVFSPLDTFLFISSNSLNN